jgi:lipoprotein-anchoring transpeptidase ErfK/SrfK
MGRKAKIAIVAAVAILALGASGVYALDTSHEDQITEGVTIAGIDVGGLSRADAERLLRHDLVAPLREPVRVGFDGKRYTLPAKRLGIHADVSGMVDAAIAAGRDGGLPTRVFRYVTGGTVDSNVPARIGYSSAAVDRFVEHVVDEIDRPARDATVVASADSISTVPGHNGRKVRVGQLRRQVVAAVDSPLGSRKITPKVVSTTPEVTVDELASEYPSYLTLDRSSYTLRLWQNLELTRTYTVAVGQVGLETPAGLYSIQDKQVDPYWHVPESAWAGSLAGQVIPPGPANPLKERWMGIFAGAGIHGTDQTYSLGSAVSHGCVRMSIPDVIELYDRVEVGTPIYIG